METRNVTRAQAPIKRYRVTKEENHHPRVSFEKNQRARTKPRPRCTDWLASLPEFSFIRPCITSKTSFHTPPPPPTTLVRPRTFPSEIDSSGCRPGYRKRSLPVSCQLPVELSSLHRLFSFLFPFLYCSFFWRGGGGPFVTRNRNETRWILEIWFV